MYSAVSIDPGNDACGVAHLRMADPVGVLAQLRDLPAPSTARTLDELLALQARHNALLKGVLDIWADVWNLMPSEDWDMDLTARNLKARLGELDRKLGPHNEALYEFQMNVNDKSRTVSQFVRYHYAGAANPVKMSAALKNTLRPAPHLDFRLYLARYNDVYRARKEHCADSLRWLSRTWGFSIAHIDNAVHKDAGDALMQLWYRLLTREGAAGATAPAPAKRAGVKSRPRRAAKNMAEYDI